MTPVSAPPIEIYYRHSDEKTTLLRILKSEFQGMQFSQALDIGAGRGVLAEWLATQSRSLTLVEKSPFYEAILKQKFPQAQLIIGDATLVSLPPADFILYSQAMYYMPVENWLPFCRRLWEQVVPGGRLVLVMNADRGDWWQAVHSYEESYPDSLSFHYRPWSEFLKELRTIAPTQETPFGYEMSFRSIDEMVEYHLRSCLSIKDPQRLLELKPWAELLCQGFIERNRGLRLNYEGSLVVMTKTI